MILNIKRENAMILVSACLAGYRCRYDGDTKPSEEIMALVRAGKAIPICPEALGGLPCPRLPSERTADDTRVMASDGRDVTESFLRGANEALRIAKLYGCERAILKAHSPSCGLGTIYDGSFSGGLRQGNGVTAELLLQNGVAVETRD